MTEFVGDPTGVQIRAMIDEVSHSIYHLKRSNEELSVENKITPDEDFVDAIKENEVCIIRKRGQVKSYLELLKKCDPAYQQEHSAEINQVFDALMLDEVNEMPISEERSATEAPIEVYISGQRQFDMERRLLNPENATLPEEEPTDVDAIVPNLETEEGAGMYL